MSLEHAAAFPSVWLTAYYALYELANVKQHQTILVHSAAGGVGSCLVQLGKVRNCKVVGVVGAAHKTSLVKTLGADEIIDKSSQHLWKEVEKYSPNGYDVILDANGVETLKQSYEHLSVGGKLVSYGFHSMLPRTGGYISIWHLPKLVWDWWFTPAFSPINMTSANKSILCFNLSYMFEQHTLLVEMMDTLLDLLVEGKIKSPTITIYSFEDVVKAHKDLESGMTVGKLVLVVGKKTMNCTGTSITQSDQIFQIEILRSPTRFQKSK